MTKRQDKRLPFWLLRLDQACEERQAANAGMSIGERLDLAMLPMAEGLSQLGGTTRKWLKGRPDDQDGVDRRLRQFAELDQRWMKNDSR